MQVEELFYLPDGQQMVRVVVRVVTAALLGALLGAERERAGKPAGLRTHMLVALGAALFVLFPAESGMEVADLSRVIQGVATGIGFIGAGSVLKLTRRREIRGITTAAGIWVTAAVGVTAGLGFESVAALAVLLAWAVLTAVGRLEARYIRRHGRVITRERLAGGRPARPDEPR